MGTYGEEGVKGDSGARPLLERGSARSQVGVGKRGDLGLHGVDARHGVGVLLPRRLPVVAATAAEYAAQKTPHARHVGASIPAPLHTPAPPAGVEPDPKPAAAPSERRGEAGGRRRVGKAQ